MGLKWFSLICCSALICLISVTQAVEFFLEPLNNRILVPCAPPYDKMLDEFIDLSNMVFTTHSDDCLEVSGHVNFLWNFDTALNFELKVETFRKKGAQYQPTMINISKKDGCKALFNPNEVWYNMFPLQLAQEDKVCPSAQPKVTWHFAPYNASLIIDVQGIEEGEYKMVIFAKPYDSKNKYMKEQICAEMHAFLHKL